MSGRREKLHSRMKEQSKDNTDNQLKMKHPRGILNSIHLKYLTGTIHIIRFIKHFQIFKQLTLLFISNCWTEFGGCHCTYYRQHNSTSQGNVNQFCHVQCEVAQEKNYTEEVNIHHCLPTPVGRRVEARNPQLGISFLLMRKHRRHISSAKNNQAFMQSRVAWYCALRMTLNSDLPVAISQVLGLQACATLTGLSVMGIKLRAPHELCCTWPLSYGSFC